MSARPTNTQVITLGCRLNAFESEMMREHGAEQGFDDAVIINTCTVTAEAERQSRQWDAPGPPHHQRYSLWQGLA